MAVPLTIWVVLALVLVTAFRPSARNTILKQVPGPWLYAATRFRLAYDAWKARSIPAVHQLHLKYGPVVRTGPNELSFNSLTALRSIYGAGSGWERTSYYRMFDAYGTPNLFSFGPGNPHRARKKLVSHMYSNQVVLESHFAELVKKKVAEYLNLLEREPTLGAETFSSLHYFSLDTISEFVYGPEYGATAALSGSQQSRDLIIDIMTPARRKLAWFFVHFLWYAKWVTSRTGFQEKVVNFLGLMPMKKPFMYSGIRKHALDAYYSFKKAPLSSRERVAETTVIGRLCKVQKEANLSDLDIASECADHLLAGIDTTSDSSMFAIWALSLPQHLQYQDRLRKELSQISVDSNGVPEPKVLGSLPYLNAVVKESLRLYAPLPGYEPRTSPIDTVVDGFEVPAGTVVGMSPYCLHREESVYPQPLAFRPERWLTDSGSLIPEADDRNRYFWAFGSGARMCIGIHLANAEMLTLLAALYRNYDTRARDPDTSPGITSRYEIFFDETVSKMEEHECYIDFRKTDAAS